MQIAGLPRVEDILLLKSRLGMVVVYTVEGRESEGYGIWRNTLAKLVKFACFITLNQQWSVKILSVRR